MTDDFESDKCIRFVNKDGKYAYKPKDKDYFKNYYYLTKGDKTCERCGSIVANQMHKHIKSKKCILFCYIKNDPLKTESLKID